MWENSNLNFPYCYGCSRSYIKPIDPTKEKLFVNYYSKRSLNLIYTRKNSPGTFH